MCHISCNTTVSAQSAVAAATGTVLTVNPRQHTKSTFRFRPFRKVAKTARVNLNRYWGLLSQSSAMKPQVPPAIPVDHSYEEEQNRINEMLEAQNATEISENARNSMYESSPEFRRHFWQSLSSMSTSSRFSYYSDSSDAMSVAGSLV